MYQLFSLVISVEVLEIVSGVPWTEEEHRMFLIGLQKLGKGDWRGIARNYVVSRTPTQVASHAQKYFIRQSNGTRRKRRSSLFDMVPDMVCLASLCCFYMFYAVVSPSRYGFLRYMQYLIFYYCMPVGKESWCATNHHG